MSQEIAAKKEESFSFARLNDTKPDVWENVLAFYGIRPDFPSNYLFYQKNTNNNLVFISEGLANGLMKCTRKYKLNVVNIGVKMFSKNRDDKSSAKVSMYKLSLYSIGFSRRGLKSFFRT